MSEKELDFKGKKPNIMQRFFIICSGSHMKTVEDHPTEWNKFTGIGATTFFTAVLAAISGGYAIHFAFASGWIYIAFGVLWGCVIFNLDRYIVLSIKKANIPTKEQIEKQIDPREKRVLELKRKQLKYNAFLMALPRIIIALIIAFTVSKPIELKLFESRIKKQLVDTQDESNKEFDREEQKRNKDLTDQLTDINKQEENDKSELFSNNPLYTDNKSKITKLGTDISKKETEVKTNLSIIDRNRYKETRYRTRTNPLTEEITREPYTVWVDNTIARAKRSENINLEREISDFKKDLEATKERLEKLETSLITQSTEISKKYQTSKENIQQQLDELKKTYHERKTVWVQANKESIDLPARLEALSSITHFSINPTNENFLGNSLWWASFIITLLFIALETAPIVVKLLTPRGIYDEVIDRVEHENVVKQKSIISQINSEINEHLKRAEEAAKMSGDIMIQKQRDKLDAELANNKIILDAIAKYQQELALEMIEKWYKEEKSKK